MHHRKIRSQLAKLFQKLLRLFVTEDLDGEENVIIREDYNCLLNLALNEKEDGLMILRKTIVNSIELLQNEPDLRESSFNI